MKKKRFLESKYLSDQEIALYWTLSKKDILMMNSYRKIYRIFIAIQIVGLRFSGKFLKEIHLLSPQIINYLSNQLKLPPTLKVVIPSRESTYLKQKNDVITYLGFEKFSSNHQKKLVEYISLLPYKHVLPNGTYFIE